MEESRKLNMNRLQYNMETGHATYRPIGPDGATVALFSDTVTSMKSLSAAASIAGLIGETSSTYFSESSVTLLQAAGVAALPQAVANGIKACQAGVEFYDKPSWKTGGKFTQETIKTTTKASEGILAIAKKWLGEIAAFWLKVVKGCGNVISDVFDHSRALDKYDVVHAARPRDLKMRDETYEIAKNEAWLDVMRTITAIAFHLMSALIVIFSATISLYVTLFLAAVFVVANVAHHYCKTSLEDARGLDLAHALQARRITVRGLPTR